MARLQRRSVIFLLGLLVLALGAGGYWWFTRVQTMRLTRLGFSGLPGWAAGDPRAALAAFRRSCTVLKTEPPATEMGGAGYAGTTGDWLGVCALAPEKTNVVAARDFFERNFVPFAVRGRGRSLFTGYYEPEILGSRTRHGAFQTPVYARPADLIDADLGAFSPDWKGDHISGRIAGEKLVPYAARAQIDKDGLANAQILFFAGDPVRVFFLQIQGSGRVRFDDGTLARIAYDGQNGRPYTAIGRTLIAQGALTREAVSLQSIRAWLTTHLPAALGVMETDQSFVFFRETPIGDPALGSAGAEGAPLTPDASLAIDPRLHALGVPFYVATEVPSADGSAAWDRLLIAQDIGGAVRGAARGDIFFGFGADAEALAGEMKSPGEFYLLLPAPLAVRLGPSADLPRPQ